MFNETTTAEDPIRIYARPASEPCPAGQVQDYDPATRTYLPGCVDDTLAYQAGGFPTGPVPVAKTDNTSLWLMMAGVGLIAILFAGRR